VLGDDEDVLGRTDIVWTSDEAAKAPAKRDENLALDELAR
jgi:hypothetical protein